jgi:hypothetical protein
MICAAREFFEEEAQSILTTNAPLIPFQKVRERTAAALKISKTTVSKVTMEKYNVTEAGSSKLSTPGKNRPRESLITGLDSFSENAVHQHI